MLGGIGCCQRPLQPRPRGMAHDVQKRAHTPVHECARRRPHARARSRSRTHTCARAHARTHAHGSVRMVVRSSAGRSERRGPRRQAARGASPREAARRRQSMPASVYLRHRLPSRAGGACVHRLHAPSTRSTTAGTVRYGGCCGYLNVLRMHGPWSDSPKSMWSAPPVRFQNLHIITAHNGRIHNA